MKRSSYVTGIRRRYEHPVSEVLELNPHGVLCQSETRQLEDPDLQNYDEEW